MSVKVLFKRLHDAAKIPEYKTEGSAGADLYAVEEQVVAPGQVDLIRLGFSVAIPSGYEIQIRPRSGLAVKGITILNSPGTVDSDYRGELMIILANLGTDAFNIRPGDRIGQAVLSTVSTARFEETGHLDDTERGEDGFGSTGR